MNGVMLVLLDPQAGLERRTTMRWRGRRPSAVTAVVRHRRDGRSGGAPVLLAVSSTDVLPLVPLGSYRG